MTDALRTLSFDQPCRDRVNACSMAGHGNRIRTFAIHYGLASIDALDDVLSTLDCGGGYEVEFTSPMYKDAWALINAVGPDDCDSIGPFILAYLARNDQ